MSVYKRLIPAIIAGWILLTIVWLLFLYPWSGSSSTVLSRFAPALQECMPNAQTSLTDVVVCSVQTRKFFNGLFRPSHILIGYLAFDQLSWKATDLFLYLRLAVYLFNFVLLVSWAGRFGLGLTSSLCIAWLWGISGTAVWYTAGTINLADMALTMGLGSVLLLHSIKVPFLSGMVAVMTVLAASAMANSETLLVLGVWFASQTLFKDRRNLWILMLVLLTAGFAGGAYYQQMRSSLGPSEMIPGHLVAVLSLPASVYSVFLLPFLLPQRYALHCFLFLCLLLWVTDGAYVTDPGRSDMIFHGAGRTLVVMWAGFWALWTALRKNQFRNLAIAAVINAGAIVWGAAISRIAMQDPSPRNFALVTLFLAVIAGVRIADFLERRNAAWKTRSGVVGLSLSLVFLAYGQYAGAGIHYGSLRAAFEAEQWTLRELPRAKDHCFDYNRSNVYASAHIHNVLPRSWKFCSKGSVVQRDVADPVSRFWEWAGGNTYYNFLTKQVEIQLSPGFMTQEPGWPRELPDVLKNKLVGEKTEGAKWYGTILDKPE